MTRPEGWRAGLPDRLVHELAQLSNRFLESWHRLIDRLTAGWARLADGFFDRWYRLSDRVAAGWERLADGFLDRWYGFSDGVTARWARLADGFLDRWYRFSDRIAAGRARLTDRLSRRRGMRSRTWVFVGVTLCALLALLVFALIRAGRDSPVPSNAASADIPRGRAVGSEEPARRGLSASNDRLPGFDVHVNERAGYLFSYPDAWDISSFGATARLVSPDGDVVMTFGTAPLGSLEEASDQEVAKATSSYEDVELVADKVSRTLQGLRSLVVGGTAIDATGASVHFLVITIQGPDENRAITVRFSADADPLEALPVIQQIVASFRTSAAE